MNMRAGRRPQDESECVYDKPRVEGETEPGWMEEEGRKGCISGSDCHRGKIGNNFPPSDAPAPRMDGRTDGRREQDGVFR